MNPEIDAVGISITNLKHTKIVESQKIYIIQFIPKFYFKI